MSTSFVIPDLIPTIITISAISILYPFAIVMFAYYEEEDVECGGPLMIGPTYVSPDGTLRATSNHRKHYRFMRWT